MGLSCWLKPCSSKKLCKIWSPPSSLVDPMGDCGARGMGKTVMSTDEMAVVGLGRSSS